MVMEIDFHNKCKKENKKSENQDMTAHNPEERRLLCTFRQLKEFNQGQILGIIKAMLRDCY